MTEKEAYGQAFENGRQKGDAEGYARGLKEAVKHQPCEYCSRDQDGYATYLPRTGIGNAHIWGTDLRGYVMKVSGPNGTKFEIPIENCPKCGRKLGGDGVGMR